VVAAGYTQRLGRTGVVGLAALVFAVVFFAFTLLPLQARVGHLREALQSAASNAQRPNAVPREEQAANFIARLPTRNNLPAVLGAIVQQAEKAGLSLDRGAYQWSVGKSGSIARYQLTLPVRGSYPAIRKFVDATLVEVPAAALAGISLERSNVGDAQVTANLRFEIFLRSGA
jgi:Tfp pilus assembly protein PilO